MNHISLKLINGYYCPLCYKFKKQESDLDKEECKVDKENWYADEYDDVQKIEFK